LTSPFTLAGSATLYAQWVPPVPVTVQVSGTQTYGGSPSFTYTTTPSGVSVASLTCATVGTSTPINSSLGAAIYTVLGSSCSGSANANYTLSFTGVTNGFVDSKATQSVKFTSATPTKALVGGATYTPTATATSKLKAAITVDSVTSAVCSISPTGVVSFHAAGTCLLDANQAGNVDYSAANQVQQAFGVYQVPVFVLDAPPTTATVGKSYAYTFSAQGTPVATYALNTAAPTWLSINSTTGALTGTPPSGTKSFTYSVIASNSGAKPPPDRSRSRSALS